MAFRLEIIPFVIAVLVLGGLLCGLLRLTRVSWRKAFVFSGIVTVILVGYLLVFFRDPVRIPSPEPRDIMAGAEGKVMAVVEVDEPEFLKTKAVRISIFLSLIDVHVNRSPMEGTIEHAQYYPGARFFTFEEKSSELNQHSSIVIRNAKTTCLVKQIVGPVARRVVYWVAPGQVVKKGEPIGMMKFGSRLDMYFPRDDVDVVVKKGDKVRAGETVVARLKQ
ncbi:MAG: phosphatidylserine decarboxylase [bacterium]